MSEPPVRDDRGTRAPARPATPATPATTRPSMSASGLSLLVPGLGQLVQRRPAAALMQFGTVAGYIAVALATGGTRAVWLAFAWNAWSAVDAYWHARGESNDGPSS